jgi:hypothetical protein
MEISRDETRFDKALILTGKLTHMGQGVLEPIGQLESVHIVEPVLDVAVHQELGHPQDLATQVERVSESALLTLLGCEGFHRLQIEIVVQMQIVQIFPATNVKIRK